MVVDWECVIAASANPGYFANRVDGEVVLTPAPPPDPVEWYSMALPAEGVTNDGRPWATPDFFRMSK